MIDRQLTPVPEAPLMQSDPTCCRWWYRRSPAQLRSVLAGLLLLSASTGTANDLWFDLGPERSPGRYFELREPLGAEDYASHPDGPRIPEPLVFDLVRPLGARQGEFEINTLAIFPLSNYRARKGAETDPFGITPLSRDRAGIEWAPEVELAVFDGFALEFELPFEDSHLEAYKFAGQYTFGTAFDEQVIHGAQLIVQPTTSFKEWDLTALYLLGVRFDETWSVLSMWGLRSAFGTDRFDERTEVLFNLSLFADLNEHVSVGLETNYARNMRGTSTLLLMPQHHWEISEHIVLQTGLGVGLTVDEVIPAFAMRAVVSW